MVQKYITLNTWSKQPATLLAVQGESQAREIIAVLIDASGVPVDLTGRTARMYVEKSDRTTVFFNGVTKDAANGVVSFILPLQATAAAGSANCQIIITDASGATLVSYGLKLDVVSSRANGVLESTSEFTALQEALATVQDIDSRVLRSAQIAGVAINDGITLAQLLSAGLAAGTGGAANNALSLGGVLAANYVQNASSANTNLTKINGWEGGNIRLSIFGKVVIVGANSGALTGTQNTFIAMLPTTVKARIGWLDAGNGIVIRDSSDDNWGIYSKMATIPSGTYAVFVMQ